MAQGKDGNIKELRKLLNGLLVFDSLHSQKDCLFLYNQVMGVERYLMSVPKNTNIQTLLKQLENEKKKIIKKRWEFFEKRRDKNTKKLEMGYIVGKEIMK